MPGAHIINDAKTVLDDIFRPPSITIPIIGPGRSLCAIAHKHQTAIPGPP
jgi:hypothetical protein